MDKIYVVYWSQSGNTQAMAEAVGEGIREAGKEAEVVDVSQASLDALKDAKAFALGCPAMGAEVLEEAEMEPRTAHKWEGAGNHESTGVDDVKREDWHQVFLRIT